MLELIAVLLPFAVYVLIIVLVVKLWRQVTPQKPKRIPVYHAQQPKPHKSKHQRIPVTHPKRNDWRTPREPKPSRPATYKPAPLTPLKISDQKRPTPERVPAPQYHPKQRELLNLLNGDHATAQRLLNQCKKNNPGSSADWVFEKVIFDIVRDRR